MSAYRVSVKDQMITWIAWDDRLWDESYENYESELGATLVEALHQDIRARRILNSGMWHQDLDELGVPVVGGRPIMLSQRGWGQLMADAWGLPATDPMRYVRFYLCGVDLGTPLAELLKDCAFAEEGGLG